MIIDDPESFKSWLTARLEPLCDADPAALAKYVYALVKKDKPVEELRTSMIGQLEVFLQKETQGFVNLLFRTLETQKYDTAEPAPVQVQASIPIKNIASSEFELRDTYSAPTPHEEAEKKTTKEPSAAILVSAQNSSSLGCAILATATGRKDFDRHGRKADSDKEDRSRRRRRGSSATPERNRRSRSRSFDRRRSRSRERDRARAWRNKSPPSRGRYDRDRRHTHSKSPVRRYSKSRSPVGNRRTRYRNRSPPRSRSRSRSPVSIKYPSIEQRDRKEAGVGISPRGENTHGDTDLRLPPVLPQSIQSVVALPSDQNSAFQTRRCRDFDEKGYCMRGDLCPYDHGSDPVILEDVDPLYNGSGAPTPLMIQAAPPPPQLAPPPPSITQVTTNNMEYNPDAPSMESRMWTRPQFRAGPIVRGTGMVRTSMGRGFPHQRELINVVTGSPHFRHARPVSNQDFNNINHSAVRTITADNQNFDFARLGPNRTPARPPFPQHGGNTSLQLKKVPLGVNTITLLNNHFSKFGKIVNIQVGFEGDPESALITFSSHTEANIAYKSTEAVLNNRFIRVFWYNPSNNNENKPKNATTPPAIKPSVLERLGAPPPKVLHNIQPSAVQHEEKVTVVNNNITKTLYIPSAMKKESANLPVINNNVNKEPPGEELKKKIEEVSQAKKKQEEARKAGIKLNADLRKRKQELLEKQLNQQKILIQRVEAGNIPLQQKNSLMATIKVLQESIESIRKDLENSVKANLTKVTKKGSLTKDLYRKTKEEIQRDLLDAELDLLNSQHEGKDTTELKKKVLELKQKALNFGIPAVPPVRGAFRGRGGGVAARARGRGRGRGSRFLVTSSSSSFEHSVVDHRPTKVLISGYEQDDKAEVLKHFEEFGEIVDYLSDDATPSLVINYKSRKDAEKAILKGRNFHDRLLSVTWATPNNSIRGGIPTKPPTPSHRQVMVLEDEENIEEVIEDAEDEDEDIGILSPDVLIHDDEDEDEEDRSWRR
ncbi:RNA-binding protein 26 isoform X2 [Halyomorpha halys]|uniref:RNA-binding protein 26 isoform X2 n=1 Tax=Halyomorpha halys TaxID=286706 RepID=UPI000D0C8F26|nr:RNA-binding protein 26 isoform X3 [Halyomorpha halys]